MAGSVVMGLVTMVASQALSGGGSAPHVQAAPTPLAPQTMPTVDSSAVQKAQSQSLEEQLARRGRASTILSQSGTTDKLGA